jgi:hypothetical protein
MAFTLAELQAKRDALQEAIWAGERRVRFSPATGEREVEYRSAEEMRQALAGLENEIAKAGSGRPRLIVVTSKGI